jgi:hypothetical protein
MMSGAMLHVVHNGDNACEGNDAGGRAIAAAKKLVESLGWKP